VGGVSGVYEVFKLPTNVGLLYHIFLPTKGFAATARRLYLVSFFAGELAHCFAPSFAVDCKQNKPGVFYGQGKTQYLTLA
jgi:hypothetical protein